MSLSQLQFLFLLTVWSLHIFGCKNIINLISVLTISRCPCVESSLVLLEKGVCYDQCVLLTKLCQPLPCFILYSKAKLACYSRYLLTSYFYIPAPCDEKDIFVWCQFQKVSQVIIEPFNFTFFGISGWAQTWVTVILNGLPWKRRPLCHF